MSWTTVAQIKEQLRKRWDRGEILAARITGAALFPIRLRFSKPIAADITERFDEVRRWAQALAEQSREQLGRGYVIEWRERDHRVQGRNTVPDAVLVPSEADALSLIGKTRDAVRFAELAETTLSRFPVLREWLVRKPLAVLDHAEEWERVLAVLEHLCARPRPGCYLRALDIPMVDTKFIEGRTGLLAELLDHVLPASAVNAQATGARNFASRYGFASEPPLIRFRILDRSLYVEGMSDLCVPLDQFARLALPIRRVFVTENKTNGLAFPDHPGAIVVFGLGYGISMLFNIAWLERCGLYYWGDVDTHGFAMLSRLRERFPCTCSMLMDEATVLACRPFWGEEPKPDVADLSRLTVEENVVYGKLVENSWKPRLRLEQERIPFTHLERFLQALPEGPLV